MENISLDINLQPTPRMKLFQRIVFAIIGIGNLYQGVSHAGWFRYFNILFGAIAIAYALYLQRLYASKEYLFTEDGIEGPLNSNNRVKTNWHEISSVELKMYSMRILLKNGNTNKLNLSNLTFAQHKNLKPRIIELIKSKGVEIIAA